MDNRENSRTGRQSRPIPPAIEPLEGRRLLSASFHHGHGGGDFGGGHGFGSNTIQFSQAPTAVQTGLKNLATTDNVAAPTATTTVLLGNSRGIETYTIDIPGTGTDTRLTVDPAGAPVTAPTNGTTTWGTLSGTGTGSNAAAAAEITKIATALGLTAPTSDATVRVTTPVSGAATYTIRLAGSSTSATRRHGAAISVDANGNPVGNQNLPYSALPTAIQNGLNTNRPSGAAALDPTSTQNVAVRTLNGVTSYSTTFTSAGTSTTVTVNAAGQLTKLPSRTTAQFSAIPAPAQTALQSLATAAGVTTAIAGTQTVNVYDEANGTTIYSMTLPATKTNNGQTYTVNITVSADQAGNPTTPPQGQDDGGGRFGDRFGGFGGFEYGGFGFVGRRGGRR